MNSEKSFRNFTTADFNIISSTLRDCFTDIFDIIRLCSNHQAALP
jgi:hypothetical protein